MSEPLTQALDNALTLIHAALDTNSSRAAFVHGSKGAGKTHLLSVLALLADRGLRGRAGPALARTLSRHQAWLHARRLLAVPVGLSGTQDLTSAILGSCAGRLRRLAPDAAPTFRVEAHAFAVADEVRRRQGDTAFFATLNAFHAERRGRRVEGAWSERRYEDACQEAAGSPRREELLGDVQGAFLRAYTGAPGGSFLHLIDGLATLTGHVRTQGYDAVVLLLDDLSPWLAGQVSDPDCLEAAGIQLEQLAGRSQGSAWPLPVVSFLARERDPRELAGGLAAGLGSLQAAESLLPLASLVHVITLEDRSQPVSWPLRSPASEARWNACFDELLATLPRGSLQTLLGGHADRELFRRLYPASPAMLECALAVGRVLCPPCEAAALVERLLRTRHVDSESGPLVGVGELWDVVGNAAGAGVLATPLAQARRLWDGPLQRLLSRHDTLRAGTAREIDARVLKTLALAAVAPEALPLTALTASRLLALNGADADTAAAEALLARCRVWADEVPAIRIGAGTCPVISLDLPGIDIEPLIARARSLDNPAARRQQVRALLLTMLGHQDSSDGGLLHEFLWRGTRRQALLSWVSMKEREDAEQEGDKRWQVVIEMPCDQECHGGCDDETLTRDRSPPTRCVAWLPRRFGEAELAELGRLVIVEQLCASTRDFAHATSDLSASEATQARALLAAERARTQQRVRDFVEVAYTGGELPGAAGAQWVSQIPGFVPPALAAGRPAAALASLLNAALAHDFPTHPPLAIEPTDTVLASVWAEMERAAAAPDLKVPLAAGALEVLRDVAEPLQLGVVQDGQWQQHEAWISPLLPHAGVEPGPLPVARLRALLEPGLPVPVQNLLMLAFALSTGRSFELKGRPFEPSPANLPDELVLLPHRLPDEATWQEARRRLAVLFGAEVPAARRPAHVDQLGAALGRRARTLWEPLESLARRLAARLAAERVDLLQAPRLRTVRAACTLIDHLTWQSGLEAVQLLAAFRIEGSETALARTLEHAGALDALLRDFPDSIFQALRQVDDERGREALQLLAGLSEALAGDEDEHPLKARMGELVARALSLSMRPVTHPEQTAPTPEPLSRRVRLQERHEQLEAQAAHAVLAQIERDLAEGDDRRLTLSYTISDTEAS
jgi:hypothetical protein